MIMGAGLGCIEWGGRWSKRELGFDLEIAGDMGGELLDEHNGICPYLILL